MSILKSINWQALFSTRVMLTNVVLAAILGALAGMVARPLGIVVFILVFALATLAAATGDTVTRCPYCSKRVKIGASACHHCGREVKSSSSQASTPAAPRRKVPAAPARNFESSVDSPGDKPGTGVLAEKPAEDLVS